MSWREEVEGIAQRRQRALAHGGPEAVAQQHAKGRLTVRERIERFADAESFHEQGSIAGHSRRDDKGRLREFTPGNYVLGIARVAGRPCVIGGEDFTQRGGSPTPAGLRKSVYAESLAVHYRLPLVRLLEGGGGSVTGTLPARAPKAEANAAQPARATKPSGDPVHAPPRFRSIMQVLATAPVASAALGPVAGFPAARLVASHFSVMAQGTAQVMIGGPALVARATGETTSKEQLGGAQVHSRSGVVDNLARDEADALAQIRRFLSYLPTNVWELPPVCDCEDPPERREEALLDIVPRDRRRIYDVRKLLRLICDRDSIFEMGAGFGRGQVTALAQMGGQPVGIWANDPRFYAGAMTAAGARKARRFVDLCDTFHLPLIAFVDEPGFMIGSQSERAGTIRYGAEAIFAVQQSRVPMASVIVRKSYGVAAAAHFGPEGYVLAWPSAEGGALPLEGGVAVAFRREIEAAEDPAALRAELERGFAERRDPFARAEGFSVHDLIDPRETRGRLCRWLEWCAPLLREQVGPRGYSIRP
ncbi:MAG: propionyl-CoA carboxylase [Deltaproteobacteria bacterium]|nr:propionyl-CoA carboxylase [Deltaproteobacteria bacterium]